MLNAPVIVILEGISGSGKTSFLKHMCSQNIKAEYIDVDAELSANTELPIEMTLMRWFQQSQEKGVHYFLIDNIDLPSQKYIRSSYAKEKYIHSSPSYLIKGIKEQLNKSIDPSLTINSTNRIHIFLTCTSRQCLDKWLLSPVNAYHIQIQNPTKEQRKYMVMELLNIIKVTLLHKKDEQLIKVFNMIFTEEHIDIIISQTQGMNMSNIVKVLRDIYEVIESTCTCMSYDNTDIHVHVGSDNDDVIHTSSSSSSEYIYQLILDKIISVASSSSSSSSSSSNSSHSSSSVYTSATTTTQSTNMSVSLPTPSNANSFSSSSSSSSSNMIGVEPILHKVNYLLYGYNNDKNSINNNNISNSRFMEYISLLDLPTPSGFIIHGPTGCGKTSLAHYIAYQARKKYKCISLSCTDLIHKVVGESEQNLIKIFATARATAPCLLILDNIDIILGGLAEEKSENEVNSDVPKFSKRRDRASHIAIDRLLSTFLVEIDGIKTLNTTSASNTSNTLSAYFNASTKSNSSLTDINQYEQEKRVIVIATSTNIDALDRSILRPGRLEEQIKLTLPTSIERSKYFKMKLPTISEDILIQGLVNMTNNKSYSELNQLFQEGSMTLLRNHIQSISQISSPTTTTTSLTSMTNSLSMHSEDKDKLLYQVISELLLHKNNK